MTTVSANIPVFIGGFRSGTTLLVNLLGMHPQLAAWFETKELCEALRWLRVLREPEQLSLEAGLINPPAPSGFTADTVRQRMHSHMAESFRRLSGAQASGKAGHERYPLGNDQLHYVPEQAHSALDHWYQSVSKNYDASQLAAANGRFIETLASLQCQAEDAAGWVNKTPEIIRFAPELRASIGPCRIINLIRNGLDVVSSAQELGWGDTRSLAFKWQGLIRATREGMLGYEDELLELRYEHLLADPVNELNRVLLFCGLSTDAVDIVDGFTQEFGDAAFKRSRQRNTPEASVLKAFQEEAGDLQEELGYPL